MEAVSKAVAEFRSQVGKMVDCNPPNLLQGLWIGGVKRMKWTKLMLSIVQRDQTCKNLQVQTQGCSDLCSLRGELSLATQKCDDQPKGGAWDEFWSGCLDEQYAEFASCLYPWYPMFHDLPLLLGGIPRNVPIEWDDTFRPARLSCCYGLLLWSECHPDSRMAVGFQHCAAATRAGLPGIEDPWAADWTCEQCGLVSWLSTLNAFSMVWRAKKTGESPKLETKVDWHRLARWKYSNKCDPTETRVCWCFFESLESDSKDTLFRPLAWLCPVSCGCLDQPQPYCPSNCRNGTVG